MASVITIAGEKLFAAKAQANEQLDIDTFIFANVPGQDATDPINREEGLPTDHVVHQQIVQQVGRINDNVVVYSTVLDSITGPFEFNWVGLYSSINDTLVAINHVPTTPKTATAAGVAGNTLNRNFGIEYSGIADLTGIDVAPETWQLDFTARLQGMDKLTQQLAKDMNGKDSFIDDAFKVMPRSTLNSFEVKQGVGYISGLRVELETVIYLNIDSYPKYVYADAYFEGDATSTWAPRVSCYASDVEMDDFIDELGREHYLAPIAIINAADDIEDSRALFDFKDDVYSRNFKTIEDAINNLAVSSGSYLDKMEKNKVVVSTVVHVLTNGGATYYIKSGLVADNKRVYSIAETGYFLQLHDDYYFSDKLLIPTSKIASIESIANRNTNENVFSILGADFVNQINATWFEVDGNYVYSISKGSYGADKGHKASFDIFDIADPNNVTRIASNFVGEAGIQVRGIAKHGDIIYLGSWSNTVYIWNVANPESPFQISSFNRATTSSLQMIHVFNGLLCCPGWNGKIDFYNIENPISPRLIKSFDESSNGFSAVQMLQNGNKLWCIGYASEASECSLLCFDISLTKSPRLLSAIAIPQIKYARYGVIENNILYVGGFSDTSRVCAVDISSSSPVLLKELPFNLSSFTKRGKYLIGVNGTDSQGDDDNKKTVAWDISDLDNPVKTVLSDSIYITYPQDFGAYIIAFTNGNLGPIANAEPNDSDAGQKLAVFDFNPLKIDGLKTRSITTKDIFAERSNSQSAQTKHLSVGSGGVNSTGPMTAPSVQISGFAGAGIIGKGKKGKSLTFGSVVGDISAGIDLFKITTGGKTGETIALLMGKLRLYGIINQAEGVSSKINYEEIIFSGMFNGFSKTYQSHMPPTVIGNAQLNEPGTPTFVVSLTIKNNMLYVSVSSNEMNENGSMLFAEFETIDQIGRDKENYLVVEYA